MLARHDPHHGRFKTSPILALKIPNNPLVFSILEYFHRLGSNMDSYKHLCILSTVVSNVFLTLSLSSLS